MLFVRRSARALVLACMSWIAGCEPAPPPASLAELAERVEDSGAITFRRDLEINPHTIFERYGALFDLPPNTTMRLVEDTREAGGNIKLRFQQFHQGIEVEGADFRVFAHNNRAISATGHVAHRFSATELTPKLSEERAWEIVQSRMNAEHYFRTTTAVQRPQGFLVFAQLPDRKDHVLAWRFDAYVDPLQNSRRVYVDAFAGTIIKEAPLAA